ncbi:MAG: T9SS type A sorting domain-containing protein [Bacteroidetes bacterium]|nr:T9SS type A sorting domain-containing protein [Bacteroidota bacterium]
MGIKLNITILLGALWLVATQVNAQSIKRQSISSIGNYMFSDKILVRQSIGQSYGTNGHYDKDVSFRPGFQQPPNFSLQLIKSTFSKLRLNVYPNPAAHSVTIRSAETISSVRIKVVSLSGKIMLNTSAKNIDTYVIDCQRWNNGVYFITINDMEDRKHSSKLIINK